MDFGNVKMILASASPSRKMLFDLAGIQCDVLVSGVDETVPETFTPAETVETLAKRKAEVVLPFCNEKLVIAADSVIVSQGRIFGKPENSEKAVEMLMCLSGKTHHVYTGVCICFGEKREVFYQSTAVTFYELTETLARWYVSEGESMGRAGAYGIEGKGMLLIRGIHGDYSNVVGIPVAETMRRAISLLHN